jgi:hypothetical protein
MPTWAEIIRKEHSVRDFEREYLLHPRKLFMGNTNTLLDELQHMILSSSPRVNYEGNLYLNALPGGLVKTTAGKREICRLDKYLDNTSKIDYSRSIMAPPPFEPQVLFTPDISRPSYDRKFDLIELKFQIAICQCFHRRALYYVTLFLTDANVYGQSVNNGIVSCD